MTSPAHPLPEDEWSEIERWFRDAMMDSGYVRLAALTALAKDAIPRLLSTVRAQRGALEAIADESAFNQPRFAEDTDTDYFLRCFRAVKQRALAALTPTNKEPTDDQ